jgi:hypothetical protein
MATNRKTQIQQVRQRRYLSRDFDSLRATLLDYARQYYPNQIQDFSESSVGGLFLDMAAYVGDNMSFYMDHLYNELNYDTAVEPVSIQRALINAGIPINGASPATVNVTVFIEVPVEQLDDDGPDINLLPVIKSGTIFTSTNSILYNLINDIEFLLDDGSGNYILNPLVEKKIGNTNVNGEITSYVLSLSGLCVSGELATDTFSIGSFVPFRNLTLRYSNVTEIINVYDSEGNTYYEVGALTHDVVYKNVLNTTSDNDIVKDTLKVIPAPYRFTKSATLLERKTTLTFGGGTADTLEDDIIPDPSEFAIATPYSKTMSRVPVNPEKLLTTNTLGVAASNTTLTINYRHGGGLDHNVPANAINSVYNLTIEFPLNPSINLSTAIRNTIEVSNLEPASGGEDALTTEELVALIPNIKNSQERIVTKEDLLARIYTMPSNLGRVFRAAIVPNSNNPLATQLFIISRDRNSKLITSPDTLKLNLKRYLNAYRMVSDSIDILDAKVINLQLKFSVVLDPSLNRNSLLSVILASLQAKFDVTRFHINQPIVISEIVNAIYAVDGVIAVDNVQFVNISGVVNNRQYSIETHDVKNYTRRQMIFPPLGGIFEIRYPEVDIIAKVAT